MLTVLLVEDNEMLRAALKTGLEATGEVRVSGQMASGEEALGACLASAPGAILMDVQLSGAMNGIEARVARHLRHEKILHWHIDHLLERAGVSSVWIKEGEREECAVAEALRERFPSIPRFGCSDCRCGSHLYRIDTMDAAEGVLRGLGFHLYR